MLMPSSELENFTFIRIGNFLQFLQGNSNCAQIGQIVPQQGPFPARCAARTEGGGLKAAKFLAPGTLCAQALVTARSAGCYQVHGYYSGGVVLSGAGDFPLRGLFTVWSKHVMRCAPP